MPLTPTQILQQVTTYQDSALGGLLNHDAFLGSLNHKFQDFENIVANLGDTVNYDLPYDGIANVGLVVSFQGVEQRVHPLTVDQAFHTAIATTAQDRIFTLDKDEYWEKIGRGQVAALGAEIEKTAAKMADSSIPVMQVVNGQSVPTGALHTESGPIRIFNPDLAAFNSYQQIRQSIVNYEETGTVHGVRHDMYLPTTLIPAIVGSGLSQFVPRRNDETAMSWDIGEYGSPEVNFYQSNQMPLHVSGLIGNGTTLAQRTLTVVSTNDPTGANITQITCTCDGAFSGNTGVVLAGDVGEFYDVAGLPDLRYVTRYGKTATSQFVDIRSTGNVNASGTTVVINIATSSGIGLCSQAGNKHQNINTNIVAGMKFRMVANHKCGLLVVGEAYYMAMPQLPDTAPFPSSSHADSETGASMRIYHGEIPFQNQRGLVHDAIVGFSLNPDYCMRICLPV